MPLYLRKPVRTLLALSPGAGKVCAAACASAFSLCGLFLGGARSPVGALSWCRAVPLEGAFCSALVVRAPKGSVRLAVADTDAERDRGLMGVRNVPAGEGMIFVFPENENRRHDFWMKNTIAPLDMVWVGVDGTIYDLAERVPATKPNTPDDKVTRRHGTGRFVIELASGAAEHVGLVPGVRITIPPLPAT